MVLGQKLVKILEPYCDKIVHRKRHYKCYPKGSDGIVVVSATSANQMVRKRIYSDFKRQGVIIKELNKHAR